MLELKEVEIRRILNPTSIDLGEYVINPFMGCEFSCLYCYVRSNRVISRKNKPWGEFVDIRMNAPQLLEKELALKKPGTVLLGSTTECFQPIEKKYRITEKILDILNRQRIYYVILTRSPWIVEYMPLLKQGFCKRIYFTCNRFSADFKSGLEPLSPDFSLREKAVNALLEEGLPVIPYFSPLLPGISDLTDVFLRFPEAGRVEFEGLNFMLYNIKDVIDCITKARPSLRGLYEKMLCERIFYAKIWQDIEKDIAEQARKAKKSYNIYVHAFGGYFQNSYS